jgi:5-methylcytosine-specific restriction endonuclease McrA
MPNINKSKRLSWEWKPTQKSWSNTPELYQNREWVLLSRQVRAEEPFCKICQSKGLTVLTEVADHIISPKQGGKFMERNNLQGLCRNCNNAKK